MNKLLSKLKPTPRSASSSPTRKAKPDPVDMSNAVEIVNELQKLVTATHSGTITDKFELYKKKYTTIDLCYALLRAIQGPEEYTALIAESCQESAALQMIASLGVADHIAASPEGKLSLKELSEKTKADEQYLSVALNSLLYHGYFTEVDKFGTQVYSNNDFSKLLISEPAEGQKTMKDAIGLSADDGAKATTRLADAALKNKDEKTLTAANIAFGTTGSLFEYMASPGNEWKGKRAGKAMVQLHGMANGGISEDYPWDTLPTPIIDVGGGIGSFELMLFTNPKNKELSFTIFDIEKTVGNAKHVWAGKPQWMQDKVSFLAGDFMKNSPSESKIPTAANAGTYVIRHVLHDWNDSQVVDILTNVRTAMLADATPNKAPKLLLVEMMLTQHSSRFTRTTSLQLLSLSGGITRTEVEFRNLIDKAGFDVVSVNEVRGVDLVVELVPKA